MNKNGKIQSGEDTTGCIPAKYQGEDLDKVNNIEIACNEDPNKPDECIIGSIRKNYVLEDDSTLEIGCGGSNPLCSYPYTSDNCKTCTFTITRGGNTIYKYSCDIFGLNCKSCRPSTSTEEGCPNN